ncbi:MAG: rubrerythrin family protein [Chloroflexi bacterium HGW-Chloroflexi-1]|nr:MAG: rubrerythrin family protein [Chloroflexi bacterium HGW-Chloroflexi-1]
MASKSDVARYRENLQAERDAIALYERLAEAEPNADLAAVYRQLADTERQHAATWEAQLREAGEPIPDSGPSWRTRVLGWLAGRFGPGFVLPTIVGIEKQASSGYDGQPEAEARGMPADERSHARIFGHLARTTRGLEGRAVARFEGRHRATGGNALRAGVLGANDGLVSVFSLMMGVAGAEVSSRLILSIGFAGLLAGALSMALGEWLSVQSSRELYEHQLGIEKQELAEIPEEEKAELTLIYQAKGVSREEARTLAERLLSDETTALDTLAREELGIDPQELGGSAWEAAITSFFLFAIGAIIPVLPYVFLTGTAGVITSAVGSALGLFAIGAAITLMTGRGVLVSGLRQVLFGLAAAAITFGVGRLIGVNVGG